MGRDNKKYDTLGVSSTASDVEIKKAYRIMALKWHPDKNGHSQESTEKFQEITEAYKVLSDPDMRLRYDKFGEEGLRNRTTVDPTNRHRAHSTRTEYTDAGDLFSQFFGDSFFGTGSRRNQGSSKSKLKKGPDIKHKLSCSLEDLYKGRTSRLGLSKTVLCSSCDAKGGKYFTPCSKCRGLGRVVVQHVIGPVTQRLETTCDDCRGTGHILLRKDICTNCHGATTVEVRSILKVEVQPGAKHGDPIVLIGEGDQGVGIIPGDVVITIDQKEHPVFKRSGDNLYYKANVDLLTALTGGSIYVRHLNGEYLKIEIAKGEIIRPNMVKCLKGYGMPVKNGMYGDLLIHFEVDFPKFEDLNSENLALLEKVLPSRPEATIPEDTIPIQKHLSDFDTKLHSAKRVSFEDLPEPTRKRRNMAPAGPGSENKRDIPMNQPNSCAPQ